MYLKNVIQKLSIVILFIIVSSSNVFANEIVTMAIGEWSPYTSEKDLKGKIAEVIVTEAFKLENINVIFKYYPWKRSYKNAEYGKVTGTFPWQKTKEREKEMIFTKNPIISIKTVFFHLKSLDFKWNNYEDLKKYKVGATLGYADVELLQKNDITVDVVTKESLNFKKLLGGRIDIFPIDFVVGYNYIVKSFSPDKVLLFTNNPKPLYTKPMFMLISKKIPNGQKIADTFDRCLKKLKDSGKYDKIIANFM